MLIQLPHHLIQSILLLSISAVVSANTPGSVDTPAQDASSLASRTEASPPATTLLTLWDVGISLRDQWKALRDEEACLVPVPEDEGIGVVRPEDRDGVGLERNVDEGKKAGISSVADTRTGGTTPDAVKDTVGPPQINETHDSFESFEEWKSKKLAEEESSKGQQAPPVTSSDELTQQPRPEQKDQGQGGDSGDNPSNKQDNATAKSAPSESALPRGETTKQDTPPPPVAAPLHNRYNYASPDCSARIHSASPQTQHASSLLHKSRDRYMLTPCKAKQHWVVVELCDEIRIEGIELGIWEFFSGVVRDVKLSVGGEDHPEQWEEVGSFVGKNVRGVQTFNLPQATSFNRFLRLDFPSHYGTEYYCPVSHLKVFGMNQMEAFKREQKNLRAVESDDRKKAQQDLEALKEKEELVKHRLETERREKEQAREKELGELERMVQKEARRGGHQSHAVPVYTTTASTQSPSKHKAAESSKHFAADIPLSSSNATSINGQPTTSGASVLTGTTSPSSSSSAAVRAAPKSDSSESIYAFITRRLNALEGNSSLIARYIEEQSRVMRTALGRLEGEWDQWRIERESEERVRWERERMRQEDRLGRVISQLEHQRVTLELDRRSMDAQFRIMSDQLSYERRRGIAQLLIMIVVIGLGVASRGSTIEAVLKPLVAEARRRRSIYGSKRYGPLAGLRIDLGADRPPAVIGEGRPQSPLSPQSPQSNDASSPRSSSPKPYDTTSPPPTLSQSNQFPHSPSAQTPSAHTTPLPSGSVHKKRNSINAYLASGTARRPLTPNNHLRHRRPVSTLAMPSHRSFSATTDPWVDGRHRNSVSASRKLARSAHLHSIDHAAVNGDKDLSTPRQKVQSAGLPSLNVTSPLVADSGSAKVPDEEVGSRSPGSTSGVEDELIQELGDIWNRKPSDTSAVSSNDKLKPDV